MQVTHLAFSRSPSLNIRTAAHLLPAMIPTWILLSPEAIPTWVLLSPEATLSGFMPDTSLWGQSNMFG